MMSGTRMTPISPRPPDVRRHRRTPAELVRWRSVARGPEARSSLRLDFFPVLIEHALYLPRLVLHHLRNETDLLFDRNVSFARCVLQFTTATRGALRWTLRRPAFTR